MEISPLSLVVVSAEIAEDFKDFWKLRKDSANEATNEIAASYRWVNSRGEDVSPPPLQYNSSAVRDPSTNIRKVSSTPSEKDYKIVLANHQVATKLS